MNFMKYYRWVFVLLLTLTLACSEKEESVVEPLGKLDFRPNSEFGFEAMITAFQLGKQVIDRHVTEDGVAKAEGYRFLFRLLEMNLSNFSADSDSAHPQISRCPSKNCKLGFDNPDYSYIGAMPLGKERRYRLYGDRGTADYLIFQVMEYGFSGDARTDSDMMVVQEDGSWEIYLSEVKPDGVPSTNWLQLEGDSARVLIRVAHTDWNNSIEPSINIEVLDDVTEPVAAFTPKKMAVMGFAFSKMLPNMVQKYLDQMDKAPINDLAQPCLTWLSGCKDSEFKKFTTGGKYRLEEDEALIIEVPFVETRYNNIQLANIWSESLDYASKQTSLNGFQAVLDSDGHYRYVLAHFDPGVPNWLDVSEHPEGSIFMRWLKPVDGKVPPRPEVSKVKLSELAQHMPADTPRVTPEQRQLTLKQRLAAYNQRSNPANQSSSAANSLLE
jgi:Protein of unknown function (DUF1214)